MRAPEPHADGDELRWRVERRAPETQEVGAREKPAGQEGLGMSLPKPSF